MQGLSMSIPIITKDMKKVLIITYYWPPSGGSGVQRWVKFVKYLRDFGYEPIVYIPQNPEYPVIDASLVGDIPAGITILTQPIWEPFHWYKKITRKDTTQAIKHGVISPSMHKNWKERLALWIRSNIFVPDARMFWIRPSVKYLSEYLESNDVDVVVSTGPPHSCHLIAKAIKQKTNIPWVADFRDPWTQVYFFEHLNLTDWARNKHYTLEKQVVEKADRVLGVSKSMYATLSTRTTAMQYSVLTNGYDASDYPSIAVTKRKKFTLASIGIWAVAQNTPNLWNVLKKLVVEIPNFGDNLDIAIIGSVAPEIQAILQTIGLDRYVTYTSYIPHQEVSKVQKEVHLLLILLPKSTIVDNAFILSGKLFECLAARRPILVCGTEPHFDIVEIIKQTNSGLCVGFEQEEELEEYILSLYNKYLSGELNNDLPDNTSVQKYTRKALTKQLAEILDAVIKQ